ncbi:MAG: signal recognition particle-docking protein FtsY, partial [Spirochaetaceae bacterium]|nr:signal recognition particle-docking protein FtsY [Spirochaetaceae bacterium]
MKFADRIKALFGVLGASDELFDELADLLVEGDLGASFAQAVADELKVACRSTRASDPVSVKRELKSILARYGRAAA